MVAEMRAFVRVIFRQRGHTDLFVNISRTQEVPKNNGLYISDGLHFGTVAQRNGKDVLGFQFEQLFCSILNVITVLVK